MQLKQALIAVGLQSLAFSAQAKDISEIDKSLLELYADDRPGASIIIKQGDQVLLEKGYGLANMEWGIANNKDTVFRIGSISKQFTAVAILMLMEQEKLKLGDRIDLYVSDLVEDTAAVTIEQLLNHTSGIPSYTGMPNWLTQMKQDKSPTEMLAYFKDAPLEFTPGSQFKYNNSGYFLLGMIIEKVSGQSYEAFIEENIFTPLGMKESYYGHPKEVVVNRATGYEFHGKWQNSDYISMTQPYAAGSLLSSVGDLALWIDAVNSYKFISKQTTQKAHTKTVLSNGEEVDYGYGWSLSSVRGSESIAHGGGINGFITYSQYIPSQDLYVAVLSNHMHTPNPTMVAKVIAADMLGKSYPKFSDKHVDFDKKALTPFVGQYRIDDNNTRKLFLQGDGVFTQRTGGSVMQVRQVDQATFVYPDSLSYFTIEQNEQGDVTGMLMRQGGDDEQFASYLGSELPEPKKAVEIDTAVYDSLVGRYKLADNFILEISRDGDKLFAQATGQQKLQIHPLSPTSYFYKEVDAQIEFVEQDGKQSLILTQGGRDMKADKLD
ncbi:serine hydrolase [Thalassotalea sp. HSM 43]|uniref:serine hydrolase n=1 Tax=Thalassotalea sp. HSM 43 TaxID=2552945 RepID=UPI001080E9FC|nr:serine hydrolase [Thalassotalea sp. HSM 43]QBY04460.1 serine hydrolase [Thalassotalea sp. HSM 43]